MSNKVLFIIGSPKPYKDSASASIRARFIKYLDKESISTEQINSARLTNADDYQRILIPAINRNNILIFISPVYLDTVPSTVIRLMEFLNTNRDLIIGAKRMIAISVCGYPEDLHNDTALRTYKRFALDLGFIWIGGLEIGEGPALVYGQTLFSILGLYHKLEISIQKLINAFTKNPRALDGESEIMKIKIMPDWMYTKVAILIARILSIKDGALNLYKRAYKK